LAFVVGRQVRSQRVSFWFFAVLFASLIFAWTFSGNLAWAVLVPNASVVFLSNLMPMLLSFAAGLAVETSALTRFSRPLVLFAFVVLATAYAVTPYVRPMIYPVELASKPKWNGDVCQQTHSSTCAPAAAATLLHLQGMVASEREMVATCLTSSCGTEPLGLFRGLALAVQHSGLAARVAKSDPGQWTASGQFPNISLVRLADQPQSGSSRWLLGPRSEGHAIVVLGRDPDGKWRIADPAFGEAKWDDEQFRSRFTGDAIYLAERRSSRL
jgi:hypothetical protein